MGVPKQYGPEIEEYILKRISLGDTLKAVCRSMCPACQEGSKRRVRVCNHLPDESTVRLWAMGDRPDFAPLYARAREAGIHSWVDECKEIADDARNDFMETVAKDGSVKVVLNREHISRSTLRINTRLWVAARVVKHMYNMGNGTTPADGSTPLNDPNPDV